MGLGNPGLDYHNTRHNAGFWLVDHWAGLRGLSFRKPWFRPFLWTEERVGDDRLVLVKPLTFMNRSGDVLESILHRFGAEVLDLLIVFDQMDLPPGRVRLKPHGSHAGHNGLKSIDQVLGSSGYHRLAIGIGRPRTGASIVEHVLGVPTSDEKVVLDAAIEQTTRVLNSSWNQGWETVIHVVNQRSSAS